MGSDKFERHRQPWRQDEIQKLHLLAGKGMSVRAIAKALTRVMDKPAIQERLIQLGITPITRSDPAKARAYVASEIARWTPIVKKLNIAL